VRGRLRGTDTMYGTPNESVSTLAPTPSPNSVEKDGTIVELFPLTSSSSVLLVCAAGGLN